MPIIFNIALSWNIFTLLLMYFDKRQARLKKWRIRERTLLGCAVLFGSLGIGFGMLMFHHKTRKLKFQILIPLFFILQLCFLLYCRDMQLFI